MHSIAHLTLPFTTLRNIFKEFIKDGGKLVIITPNAEWLRLKNGVHKVTDDTVVSHFTEKDLRTLVIAAGFRNVETSQFGYFSEEIKGERERILLTATK